MPNLALDLPEWLTWEAGAKVVTAAVNPTITPIVGGGFDTYRLLTPADDPAALKPQQQAEYQKAWQAEQLKNIEAQKKRQAAANPLNKVNPFSVGPGGVEVDWQKLAIVGGVVLVGFYLLRKR